MAICLLTWHYAACCILLAVCWALRQKDKLRLCVLCDLAMLVIAVVGFYLSYHLVFVESGKTFAMYVQRYALYSFGVFVLPVAGFLITMGCSGDQL